MGCWLKPSLCRADECLVAKSGAGSQHVLTAAHSPLRRRGLDHLIRLVDSLRLPGGVIL